MGKYDGLKAEIERLKQQARRDQQLWKGLRTVQTEMKRHDVPTKKQSKGKGKVTRDWTHGTLQGVPGGGFAKMAWADKTGTRTQKPEEAIGLIKSQQNSNTTSTVHDAKVRGLLQ